MATAIVERREPPLAAVAAPRSRLAVRHDALDQGVHETEEAEREQDRSGDHDGRLARGETAEQDQQLAEEQRRRRQPAERAEAHADRRRSRRRACRQRASGLARERRLGRVEQESPRRTRATSRARGRRRAAPRRRSPADARTRCRARGCPCARGSSTPAGASAAAPATGTGRRSRATPARTRGTAPRPAPPVAGASASCTRHATSITVGSSAADSRALTGGGASLCASGSQLWTGAQPIFVARPARISTSANSAPSRSSPAPEARIEAQSRDASEPAADRRVQGDDPEQRHGQAERGEDEVLPARLERAAPTARGHQQRRCGRRRLDQQPRHGQVVDDRQRQERRPEQVQRHVVRDARRAGRRRSRARPPRATMATRVR